MSELIICLVILIFIMFYYASVPKFLKLVNKTEKKVIKRFIKNPRFW